MDQRDTSAMHEAMEQQNVTIAKAGIMATLNSRCSILAAANPKFGRYDPMKTIAEQIDFPPPLLSRFDIIFKLIDTPDKERDRLLVMMMWGLGGRVSDIINIQTKDVDFSKKEIILTVKKRHGY
ncbi:hypothetical protein SE19_08725, partial [Acidiplasma aeolicum]